MFKFLEAALRSLGGPGKCVPGATGDKHDPWQEEEAAERLEVADDHKENHESQEH
jgi:hypothetical protein